ncbi:MAG: NADH-quinone oxidoreductase subunit K [Candidatus Asgardarchaeia archaeon]
MNEIILMLIYLTVIVAAITVELMNFKKVVIALSIYGIVTTIITLLNGELIGSIINFITIGVLVPLLILNASKKVGFTEKEKYFGTITTIISLAIAISVTTIGLFIVHTINWEFVLAITLITIGTYALAVKGNLIKIVVGYTIYDSAFHLLFSLYAVLYEPPETLTLTVLIATSVILLGVVASILYLAIHNYQKTGVIDSWSLRRLKW